MPRPAKTMTVTDPESTAVDLLPANPVIVLTDEAKYSEFYAKVKGECDKLEIDLTTATGRAKIAAQAYKVTRSKTAIDAAGKLLNEAARQQIDAVDAQRRKIRTELDALAEEVRKPLTEWEAADDDRKVAAATQILEIEFLGKIEFGETSDAIRARLDRIESLVILDTVHKDDLNRVITLWDSATLSLGRELNAALKYEADQAELAKLRAEKEKLRAEKEERDRKEQVRLAEQESARVAEQAEIERKANEERVAAETKRREEQIAERARQAAIDEAAEKSRDEQVKRDAEIKAEQDKKDAATKAAIDKANAESARLKKEADDKLAAEQKAAAEQAARDKDKAHRSAIMKAAKEALMTHGDIDEASARKLVLAILADEIPNVTLRF